MLVAQRVVKVGRLFLFETRDVVMVVLVPITTMLAVSMRACWLCTVVCTVLHLQVRGPTFNMGSVSENFFPSYVNHGNYVSIHGVATIPTIFGMAMQMLPGTSTSCPFRNKCPILQLHSMQIPMKCSFKSVSHGDFSASSVPRGTVVFFGLVLLKWPFWGLKIPNFLINPKIILLVIYHYISPFPTDNHFMNFMVNVPPNFVPVKSRVLNFHVSWWTLPCGRSLFPH